MSSLAQEGKKTKKLKKRTKQIFVFLFKFLSLSQKTETNIFFQENDAKLF